MKAARFHSGNRSVTPAATHALPTAVLSSAVDSTKKTTAKAAGFRRIWTASNSTSRVCIVRLQTGCVGRVCLVLTPAAETDSVDTGAGEASELSRN